MKVVNDCSERGIALIQTFNTSITKNEEQFQYLLRLVQLHKKKVFNFQEGGADGQ